MNGIPIAESGIHHAAFASVRFKRQFWEQIARFYCRKSERGGDLTKTNVVEDAKTVLSYGVCKTKALTD